MFYTEIVGQHIPMGGPSMVNCGGGGWKDNRLT